MTIAIDGRLIGETGVGRYIRNLIGGLAKMDAKNQYVVLLQTRDVRSFVPPGANWRVETADIPWHSFREQVILPFLLKRLKVDVLHVPYFTIPVFFPGKIIVTIHDLIISHFDTGRASTLPPFLYTLKRLGYRFVLSLGLRRAKRVIAVSHTTEKELLVHYPFLKGKITVTYEGVDPNFMRTKSGNSPLGKPYFLYVGNFYPHKNVGVLLEAFKEVREKLGNPPELVLVGKRDAFWQRLEEAVKASTLVHNVRYVFGPSDKELQAWYAHAVALVVPSLMEGFSLPPLEAIACGCPVICSDIPVHREILGSKPVYFDPAKPGNLAAVMIRVFSNKHRLSQTSPVIDTRFSWQILAEATHRLYEELA